MLKLVIALVLLAHGIGHSMGLLQIFKVATVSPQWHGDSWLLTGLTGATVIRPTSTAQDHRFAGARPGSHPRPFG